jgi:hypothetical protein
MKGRFSTFTASHIQPAMKKLFLSLFLLITSFTLTYAQIGLGIGSSGFNLKTSPDKTLGLIARSNFIIANNSFFIPEINGIKRLVNEEKTKLYLGVGLGSVIGFESFDNINSIFAKVPVGIEYFPFESKRISLTAETGLNFSFAEHNNSLGFLGILEITFYLNK